mmetsp:Transcript_63585/g.117167  ORF Transcript_63585/g.117167 Transcript_63585/m.117167 type:complete len:141 (+) Transcript_63585:191-613(+)
MIHPARSPKLLGNETDPCSSRTVQDLVELRVGGVIREPPGSCCSPSARRQQQMQGFPFVEAETLRHFFPRFPPRTDARQLRGLAPHAQTAAGRKDPLMDCGEKGGCPKGSVKTVAAAVANCRHLERLIGSGSDGLCARNA